jgi:hypothetical protein
LEAWAWSTHLLAGSIIMTHKLRITMAALVAIAVVAIGVTGFACGGHNQSSAQVAFSSGQCAAGCPFGGSGASECPFMKQQKLKDAGNSMAAGKCGDQSWFGANVFEVCDGREFAICQGREIEVCDNTPYIQIGDARYFLDNPRLEAYCTSDLGPLASELDREAVALATVDGNVVGVENGQKIARCLKSGRTFTVTPDSQVRVMNGRRYYSPEPVDLASSRSTMHR